MSERGFDMRRNGLGLVLFAIGAFFAVLLIKGFTSEVPPSEAGGTGALAALWFDSIGGIAGLVFCAGLALVGARTFLSDAEGNALKHAGGLALVAVGISIVAGAIWNSGGAIGSAIGGGIASSAHVAIGALVGIGVIAIAVWGVWLKGAAAPRGDLEREIEDDGVTAAEAAALIPTDSNRTLGESRKTERASTWTAPPSPYPEDVRRRGEIPAGAKPLDSTHAQPTQSGAQAGSVYRWTAARADEPADVPGEDLAGAVAVAPQLEPSFAIRESELPDDTPALVAESLTEDDRVAIEEVEQEAIEDELREVKALVAEEELDEPPSDRVEERPEPLAEELPEVPRPSWEQSSLFDEADEPVDAYGTPLTLVDEIVDRARDEEVATAVEEAEEDHELEEEEEEEEESDEDEEEYDEYDEYDDDADAEDSEEYEDDEEVDEEEEVYAEDEADDEAAVEEEIPGEEENSPEPAVASQAPLKDVVLTPVAPSVPADRQKLLVDAGCLFLDRGRVAVSMLQRQYSMDFDDACKVLDELQEMGLIGPYLGGQRRDILLTRDQWLERVASS